MKHIRSLRHSKVLAHRRFGVLAASVVLLGAFALTACHPNPAHTALKLTLTDTAASPAAPAANVTVSVFPAGDTSAPATAHGITDGGGNVWFTHDALPAGSYVVRFGSPETMDEDGGYPVLGSDNARWYNGSAADAATDRSGAATVTVVDTAPTELAESYGVPRGHLDGYLFGNGSARLAGVTVTMTAVPSNKVVATTTSDANGHYLFTGVPAQSYKVGYAKPGWTTIWAGVGNSTAYSLADAAIYSAVTGDFDDEVIDHYPASESTITGTVIGQAGTPVANALVIAYTADTDAAVTYAEAASDGTFTLHGLSATGYRLEFIAPGNTYAPMVLGAGTGPGVTPNVANGSTFSLQAGGNLSLGTVSLTVGAKCADAQAGSIADLFEADLHNCDLSDANLTNVDLSQANLSGADLSAATLPNPGSNGNALSNANLSNANLSHAQAVTTPAGLAEMSGADLSGADLSHASMAYSVLSDSNLTGANLSHADLSYTPMDGADVSGADLSSTTFQLTETDGLNWSTPPTIPGGYRLIGDNLVGAGTFLLGADLSGANLSGMDLSNLCLRDVNLTGADLSNSTLTSMNWSGVDLSGADLSGATLSVDYSADLTSDANTVLPAGWEIVNGTLQQTGT